MAVWTVLPCQVTSRGRPTLTESKRPITFPNDDRRKFEVNQKTQRRPLAQKSSLRTSYGHSPRYVPPQEIPMTLRDTADFTCTFPFDLRKKRVISMYEWPAKLFCVYVASHNFAASHQSKVKPFCVTLRRHRGPSRIHQEVVLAKQLSLIRSPDALIDCEISGLGRGEVRMLRYTLPSVNERRSDGGVSRLRHCGAMRGACLP